MTLKVLLWFLLTVSCTGPLHSHHHHTAFQALLSHGVLAASPDSRLFLQLIFKTTPTCIILIPVLMCIEDSLRDLARATFPLDLLLLSFSLTLLVYPLVPKHGLCISTFLSLLMPSPHGQKRVNSAGLGCSDPALVKEMRLQD